MKEERDEKKEGKKIVQGKRKKNGVQTKSAQTLKDPKFEP